MRIALTGATVITVSGADIENGTVLIENGVITAVGADVEIPFDAFEYDLEGKFVMPGMIDPHSAAGMNVQNEPLPVAPFVSVRDAIDQIPDDQAVIIADNLDSEDLPDGVDESSIEAMTSALFDCVDFGALLEE